MAGTWEGQVVATTALLPPELTAALLAGGARAVVARSAAAVAPPSPAAAVAFSAAFYDQLLAGRALLDALAAAGRACPELADAYMCNFRRDEGGGGHGS